MLSRRLVALSLFIGSVLCLGVPGFAHGDQGFYIRGELGGSFSQGLGGEFVDNLGESVGFGLGIGYRFLPVLRMDIVGTYRPHFGATVSDTARFQGKVTTLTVMGNAYWDIIRIGMFTPYIGAGIGLARNETHEADVASNSSLAPLEAQLSGTARTNFAYQAMAGLSLRLTSHFALDMSYHYLYAGEVAYKSSGRLLGEAFTFFPTGPEDTLRLHEVFLSVRYNLY
jgi:opacity protein-like surface antigen